ncbi:TRAP-type C4-dicarboxylate transport system permease small subunit [Amorphus suaedae]
MHPADPTRANAIGPKGYGRIVEALAASGSILTLLIAGLIAADVFTRNLFNLPLMGVVELVAMFVVAAIFLQLPGSIRARRIARAEIFLDPLVARHPRFGRMVLVVYDLAGLAVFLVIAYATWPRLERTWVYNEFIGHAGSFTFPAWPLPAIILLGSLACAVQYGLAAFGTARDLARGNDAGAPETRP